MSTSSRRLALLPALLLLSLPLAGAERAAEQWTVTLTRGPSQLYGAMIDIDAADNVYVVGSVPASTIVTAKLDSRGNLLWQVEFDNPGTREVGVWIDVDRFGDIVVAGQLVAGASQLPAGQVVLKYDAAGNLLWSRVTPATRGAVARMVTDAAGNVIVLGRNWLTNSSGNTTDDLWTMKYSPAGTLLWTRAAGVAPTSVDNPAGLAVDAAGNVFVNGGTIGTMLTEAYDPAGGLLWSRQAPAVGVADLVLGNAGSVIGVGGTWTQPTGNRILVVVYDAAGNLVSNRSYPGYSARRAAVDSRGNLVVTGYSVSGYTDWITHQIDPNGLLLWSQTYNQHRFNDEFPYALVIGPDDEIYVTGQGGPGPSSGTLSLLKTVTVRYSRAGVQDWAATSDLSVRGLGVVRGSDNGVTVVGESTFTVFHYTQTGVWTSTPGALAGAGGAPRLEGTGSPSPGAAVSLSLSGAAASSPAVLVVGAAQLNLPFLGGLLVPRPDVVVALATGATGGMVVPLQWPAGVPSGVTVAFQFWIADPGAPQGLAASNGLLGVSE